MRTLLKHAFIEVKRLQLTHDDSSKLRVSRIDQAVVLVRGENRRYEKQAALTGGHELIAKSS